MLDHWGRRAHLLFDVLQFNYLGSRKRFWYAASLNSVGIVLTLLFTPEPLRVPVRPLDVYIATYLANPSCHTLQHIKPMLPIAKAKSAVHVLINHDTFATHAHAPRLAA